MTVLEALPKNEDGDVVIPIGGYNQYGEPVPGTVTITMMYVLFGSQLDQTLPLTEEQFATLKSTRTGNWELNWQMWRDDGTITVE